MTIVTSLPHGLMNVETEVLGSVKPMSALPCMKFSVSCRVVYTFN